ncbi:MAG: hypothetical protein JSU83_07900 [Deltaproteobacteria bacterium]|nr:MAG: hypothetical protein JSU83_07900 [Deltaproteobacteria bacterium]
MMMLSNRNYLKHIWLVPLVVAMVLVAENGHAAKQKDKDNNNQQDFAMTEAELQSQVMSFADRFASIITAAFHVYDAQSPPPEHRRIVRSSTAYAMAAAVTIAAEADPDVALLDMVAMVGLGRMVLEEHWRKKFGKQIDPILKGFQKAEEDIWLIAKQVLNPEQQEELSAIIKEWRQDNPEVTFFSYVRFSDFASERRKSKLAKTKAKGIFKSVEIATRQVEEARLLAERGMYLGARLPMMTGMFADVWLSTVLNNPEVNELTAYLDQFSDISGRLADLAEKLPTHITTEREAAVKQVMEEMDTFSQITLDRLMEKVAIERETAIKQLVDQSVIEGRRTIEELFTDEKGIRGLLTDLRQTLLAGNELLTSANNLTERLNLNATEAGDGVSSKPFDIKDYQTTLTEASTVIQQLDGLVKTVELLIISPGWENSLPRIIEAVEKIEAKGGKWITYSFLLGIALILIFLVGAVLAMLSYRYLSQRIGDNKDHEVNAA